MCECQQIVWPRINALFHLQRVEYLFIYIHPFLQAWVAIYKDRASCKPMEWKQTSQNWKGWAGTSRLTFQICASFGICCLWVIVVYFCRKLNLSVARSFVFYFHRMKALTCINSFIKCGTSEERILSRDQGGGLLGVILSGKWEG